RGPGHQPDLQPRDPADAGRALRARGHPRGDGLPQTPATSPPARTLTRRRLFPALLLVSVACARPEPLARLGTVPAFQLVERSGRPVTSDSLRGKTWVADFIFTRCGAACPAMTARMARLRREVPAEVVFVSFTVDPAYDTPENLSRYAASFRADEEWLFVTGPQKALYALSTGGFKLAAMEVPPEQQKE